MLNTARLILEAITPAHACELFDGLSNPCLYEFIDSDPPASVAWLQKRFQRLSAGTSSDGREIWLNWAVRITDSSRYIGTVQATINQDRTAHIAYVLFDDSWGYGYAREATTEILKHLHNAHSITVFRADVDPRNQRSIALLESLGFRQSAYRANATIIRHLPADEAEYRLVVESSSP